jgi:DNA repair protein RadC
MNKHDGLQAAEVQLIYKSKISSTKRLQIKSSQDAFNIFWEYWDKETIEHVEEFKMLLLNNKNMVLGIASISKGGTTSTIIDPRIIFQYALRTHSSAIIVAHNHPSSNPTPSESDVKVTKKLTDAGAMLDIKVLDHLVICVDGTYFSLGDEGRMQ